MQPTASCAGLRMPVGVAWPIRGGRAACASCCACFQMSFGRRSRFFGKACWVAVPLVVERLGVNPVGLMAHGASCSWVYLLYAHPRKRVLTTYKDWCPDRLAAAISRPSLPTPENRLATAELSQHDVPSGHVTTRRHTVQHRKQKGARWRRRVRASRSVRACLQRHTEAACAVAAPPAPGL